MPSCSSSQCCMSLGCQLQPQTCTPAPTRAAKQPRICCCCLLHLVCVVLAFLAHDAYCQIVRGSNLAMQECTASSSLPAGCERERGGMRARGASALQAWCACWRLQPGRKTAHSRSSPCRAGGLGLVRGGRAAGRRLRPGAQNRAQPQNAKQTGLPQQNEVLRTHGPTRIPCVGRAWLRARADVQERCLLGLRCCASCICSVHAQQTFNVVFSANSLTTLRGSEKTNKKNPSIHRKKQRYFLYYFSDHVTT